MSKQYLEPLEQQNRLLDIEKTTIHRAEVGLPPGVSMVFVSESDQVMLGV